MKKKYWTIVERASLSYPNLRGIIRLGCIYSCCAILAITSCTGVSDKRIVANAESSPAFVNVDLCDVLNKPSDFDGKNISIHAILITGFESSFAYDPRCASEDRLVWFEVRNDSVSEQLAKYFNPDTVEFREKGVNRVKGQFSGVFQTKKKEGFGHLNSANYLLTVTQVTNLSNVESDESYPW